MNKAYILVVEDDVPVSNLITTTLKAHEYRYITAKNGETAILQASSHNPDIILFSIISNLSANVDITVSPPF